MGILRSSEMKLFDSVTFILMFSYLSQPQVWLFSSLSTGLCCMRRNKTQYHACFKLKPQAVAWFLPTLHHMIFFCSRLLWLEELWRNLTEYVEGITWCRPKGLQAKLSRYFSEGVQLSLHAISALIVCLKQLGGAILKRWYYSNISQTNVWCQTFDVVHS